MLLLCALAFAAFGQGKSREKVTLNFVGADIPTVVKAVGEITQKNFILDPRVTGTITILSSSQVSRDLVYPILLSALRLQGFTAVEGPGNTVKILPEADAKLNYSPTIGGVVGASGDKIVTQVYPLKYESAAQLLPVLRPLIAPNNVINAYPNNNTLVITDYAENLKRINKIIEAIDVAPSSELEVIRLRHASALELSQVIPRLLAEAGQQVAIPGAQPKLAVAVDSRINGLIVRADSRATIQKVRSLVESLDLPTSETGNIHVIYLRNAEATKVAETLRGILGGSGGAGAGNAPAPPPQPVGQPGQPAAAGGPAPVVNIPQQSGGGVIQAYPSTNSLVVVAPDFVYNSIRSVIDKLDARRAQVFIEALIVEVDSTKIGEFGIQWFDGTGLGSENTRGFGGFGTTIGPNIGSVATNPLSLSSSGGLNLGVVNGSFTFNGTRILNLGVLAKALESDANTNILSTPTLLTIDNEEAKIVVGQNVPFITGTQTSTTGGLQNPFQTIERKDVGLQLKVKPTVSEGGTIKLTLFQEVSDVGNNIAGAGLITNKRSIESTVLVDDGQIIVLGGLIQDNVSNTIEKVPVLGNIPLFGNLFKYENRKRTKNNLMVFIRPVILRDSVAPIGITNERYDYIRNEQSRTQPQRHLILPDIKVTPLPAIEPAKVPEASSAPPPAAKAQPAPEKSDDASRWQPMVEPDTKSR